MVGDYHATRGASRLFFGDKRGPAVICPMAHISVGEVGSWKVEIQLSLKMH
jgi:hypothetical protein